MVKKLQALKAKKGFTLVELIVVIAIIGVLAAILVPTMMGMVTKARVTSADQTAEAIAKTVTTWMSELESNKGTIPSKDVCIQIVGKCVTTTSGSESKNEWQGSITAEGFLAANDTAAADEAKTTIGKGSGMKAARKLADSLANDYNFNSDITAIVWVSGRKVIGCAYCDTSIGSTGEGDSAKSGAKILEDTFPITSFRQSYSAWDGKTDGICADKDSAGKETGLGGKIIGTNPKLLMDNAPAKT